MAQNKWTKSTLERYIKEGRGQGTGANYLPRQLAKNIEFLSSVLDNEFFTKNSNFIMNEVVSLFHLSPKEFGELIDYFSESLHRYEEKIFDCIDLFVEKFSFMIPVFGLSFYQDKSLIDNTKGITTVIFNDLKRFYIDVYEVITELLELLIAFNNLKHRGNFNNMKTKRKDVVTLEDYIKKIKEQKRSF